MSKRPPLATELEMMLREQHRIGYVAGFRDAIQAAAEICTQENAAIDSERRIRSLYPLDSQPPEGKA